MKDATRQRVTLQASGILLGFLAAVLLPPAVRAAQRLPGPDTAPGQRVTRGGVTVSWHAAPPAVRPERDVFATLEVEAPAEYEIDWPRLEDRTQGLTLLDAFDDPVDTVGGRRRYRRCFRFRPGLVPPYRVAPLVLAWSDRGRWPAATNWISLRALRLPPDGTLREPPRGALPAATLLPPPFNTRAWSAGVTVALFALTLGFLAARVLLEHRRRLAAVPCSPRETALADLEQLVLNGRPPLLAPADFFTRLTLVVRRYLETSLHMQPLEQTTPEFLDALRRDACFEVDFRNRIGRFLEAADLVKFAARTPAETDIIDAVSRARALIQTEVPPCSGSHNPTT
jgi:hypothetical protein